MGQISDFLDDDDKRREAASAGAGALQAATPQPATPPAAPPASAAQPESEISRFLADAPPPERGLKGWAQDIGATAVKGAIAVPEIAVGLADMVTGGHAGHAAEGLGLRFKEAREIANDWHSEATKEAQRQFQQAEGVTGKAAAALQNPSVIATAVGESLPQMFAGGLIGRGLMLAGRMGPALAGALGEGIVGAGSAAEQIRQESPNGLLAGRQAGLAGLSGAATAGFGLLGGKMAQRLGIGDVETMLAGAGRAAAKPAAQPVAKGLPRQMAQGALSEGVLEELPQSVSEQALQNIALDRPWQEDVDSAAVLGTLSGGVMGAGASGLHGLRSRPAGAEPLKPSQRMGLDAHGGQLSAAAVVAVDSGASPAALAAAAQQGAQPDAQQGALQESAEAQQAALAAGQAQGPREAAALERVAALDEQLAAARQSLAALAAQAAAPDGAQDEPQQAARAQLAQQVQQLQAERESLTQGWPRMQAGKALRFGTESGAQLAGHWALAEADQLVTSHDEGLRQNPAYPQQLQPRERSRAASEAQIARMAQRLQPERLAHSADAATGAPIVGADGLVESGNARSIALKRVYAGQGPQAAAYKDFLQAHAAEFGLTPEQVAGMQKPVLVRVRDTPVNRAEFARQANAPTVAMMSPAEQARADAARMDSMDGLEPDESGDFSGAASRGFVRRFMARLPVSEQAAMVDADGRLSSAGYARVRNAVLAKAWGAGEGGSDALARMTESLDDNTRSISRALMMAAPETARMREAIAAGARHDADIAGDVAAAAQEISRLREAGQSVQQALAQTDAFGDKHTPEARALMQFMADNARRPRRIAQLIQAYWQALDAAGDPHQQGIFGGQAAPTKQALLQAAMRQVQDAPAQGAAQERETQEREVQESAAQESAAQERETQEREAQDRAQAAWNALPPEGRHQLALAAGVQGVVARNAARHADWSGLPAAMQQRLAQAVKAAPEAAQAALASRRAKALTDDERAAVLQGPPVASLTGDEAPRAGMQSVRQWATRLFAAQGGLARNPEIGPVVMDARSVRDSMAHGKANPFKYAAFAAVKDVLEQGVLVASSTHGRDGESHFISAPVQIAGKDDVVTVLVRRDPNEQRMYLHSVATKEYLLNRRVSGTDTASDVERSGSSSSGDAASVAPAGAPGKLPGHHVAQRLHELLTRRVGAASAAPGRDNAGHETAHKSAHQSAHESGVPRGLAARETADSRQLEGIINRNLERSGQEAAFKALAVGADQLPDALRGALAAFERATGARAVVFRNLTPHVADFNGVTVRDGTLFINETSQSPITGVAAHEWLHNLRRTHPGLYHELAAEVARQGDAQGFARQWGYAPGEAQEELTAAAVGDAMTDPQFLARLAEQDGSLFARVAKSFLAFLDTLTARWRSQGSNAYLRDVQAFRDKLAAVLQAYEQQAGQAGKMGQAGLPQAMFQRVWHGTPHKGIEKTGFRLDKIGTGEGLQVYGHGIYFASRREVAEFYRGMRQGQVRLDGRLMTDGHHRGAASTGDAEVDALLLDAQGDVDKAIAWARDFGQDAQAAKLERLRGRVQRGEPGQLYAAEIPEDDDLLDWDKPLDEQPAKVRRALLELAGGLPADGRVAFRQAMARRATGQDVYAFLAQRAAGADASAEGVQKGQRAASELLLAHGIPGLRYLDGDSRNAGEGSHNYVIWDEGLLTPEAAQIAPQYSRKRTDGFYSALQEAVENAPMKAGDAQAWKQYLTGQINKGAVKEDEVFWSGVREWLDAQQGKVSRQGVQDWLAGNHVRIEPVWEGLKYTVQDLDGDQVRFDSLQDAQAFYEELVQRAHDMVQVHEDDDEIIIEDTEDGTQETLTRDEDGVWTGDMSYEAFDTREAALQYAQSLADAWRETWQERLPQGPQRSGNRKYHEYSFADKGANYRELLLTAQVPDSHPVRQRLGVQQHAQQRAALERQQKDAQDRLQSARRLLQQAEQWQQQTGWGDDERFAYFTGQDGTRFFATRPEAEQYARQAAGITSHEALLSRVHENTINALREYVAWQQKDSEEEAARLERVLAGLPAPGPMTGMLYGSNHWDTTDVIAHTRLTDFENGQTLFVEELQSDWAQDVRKGEASAHAPFVDSTGKWLDLLLKQVLLQAAEGGYARVAFIGGQQSADRYRLDRQISRIEYDNGRLMAYRKDGGGPIRYDVQPGQLKGVIGEQAAQKLLDAPVKDGVQVIEGDDLKIGGEGMRAFYDNVVPKALGKLLKKADKSVQLQMHEQPETGQKQLSFEMTPALREKLDEGLPLFSRKQATKAAYDKRIDALFAGAKPALQGVRVLDRSDVLGLLGMSDGPVHLVESKVEQGRFNHGLTASDWKKVPEWLDRPAAVFDSETTPGRLVFIAPERVRGAPVRMVIDPREQDKGVNLLINAYDAERNPFARWEREGLLRYFDRQQAQKAAPATGSFQPRLTGLPGERGRRKILTEKHLAGWRKLHAGQAQPGDEAARFSRRAPEPLEPRPDEAARLKESALEQLDRVFSHPGTVSWWHKTVGTMRNLAERQPLFKPVYEAAQQFIDDVSHFANDAADFAPRLLPRLESWRDLGKRAVSAADSQAVAAPLFEGTLSYTRGKDGSLVKTDDVDAAGVVFTDAELKGRFGLTPAQIELYRQARAAIDRSIDTTARADILRLAGRDFAHLRQAVMDAPDLRAAAVQVVEAMQEVMQGDAKRRDAMRGAIEAAQERVQTAQALMQRGYAPLTRFGRYTLDVVDAQGQRQYFGLYESRREANVAAIHMRSQYPGAQVTQGTLSDDAYKLFAGITPESLELFGDLLAAPGQGKDKGQDKAFQAWLQLARNNRSAIKRLIHRKGVAGYSQDAGRVLASFIYANARQTAGALNAGRMDRAIAAIPKEQGQLRDVAMALRDYTQNPREEGQAIRGMLFAQYLGGSLASAAVNMTQPFAVTLPWLSQFGGMRQAAAQMTRALADMARPGHRYEADLARDMKKAEEDGVVSPQEIHQLMAQARGAGALRSGDGTRRGDALAAAANAWERLKVAWGQPFALAEQFNRRSTYIAAWRLARQQGMADADAFARRAVLETQFVYTKANKARWSRGAVGGALFTFKTYSVSYLELMHRMWTQGGTPGKQGVAWMLAMLLLMGGAGGLPFMEDAEDLVDGLAQLAGYNTSAKQWRQQALQDIVGDGLAEFIESGVSGLPGAPIDISGRLGMGNLLPGTGLLLTKQNRERDLLDVAGPAGDLLARGFAAGRKLLTGDAGGAAMELAPTAVRNLAKGADMLATGSYRDAKGYKVLDTTALEALAKAAGFQPRSVAQVQEGNSFLMRSKSFYQHTSAEIKAQWARALFEKDEAALQRVRQRVADWNRRNPEQPITVRMPDIWRRVREMGKERSQRIADSAPRALRQQMRQALAQEG